MNISETGKDWLMASERLRKKAHHRGEPSTAEEWRKALTLMRIQIGNMDGRTTVHWKNKPIEWILVPELKVCERGRSGF